MGSGDETAVQKCVACETKCQPGKMARWLSSSRKKKIRDIRNFIPVHGKMLKPEESSSDAPVSSETLGIHVMAAWATSGAKQVSLVQLKKKATAELLEGRRSKVPASSFSTGIRRKVAAIGTTNCEEGAITSHGMLEDKENFSDQMLSHSSPSLCHRLNDHKQLLQPRRSANISTANVDVNSGRMSPRTNSKQVPLTLVASGPLSTASPPSKRLRIEQYCSSNKSPSHKHTCENYVKAVCSQEEDICADNFEFHDIDNQVKPNAPGFKQSKSCRSSQDVHIIQTSVDSTLQSAGITDVNKSTTPTKGSNSLLSCTTCLDNTNVRAETPVLSSRSEEESLSLLWDSPEKSIHVSQERSRMLSNSDGNNIDTDELLAELSNCEKIV